MEYSDVIIYIEKYMCENTSCTSVELAKNN